jgi:membrane-bound lytic murein transglycosylase F
MMSNNHNNKVRTDTTAKKWGRPLYSIGVFVLCLSPFMLSGSSIPSLLDRIITDGYLPILSSNGPITYFEGPFGYTGFEYDLAEAFANYLGVELIIQDQSNLGKMLQEVGGPAGQFAAYGLSLTEERE